ncbi:MAG TPA: hypothetical protein QF499_02735 [Gammaproteobacteria bacterium]|jgi:hypothetical protein|nr:hypothetical protein [Chromatiales bacterium]MCP4926598.1 hypothetical protein [Gammaproteobacteria bacterium]MDP7153055.1 hypothetical protein [Gammaproteobacteria bacterium]MDP7297464.1 hypothetical protein [Gammaproteobacteria bacterium]MDP7660422.1 hypothetical protein [Gammaproteobacteria bacterium]
MDSYTTLLYVHLLLFVYWLGADVGVFGLALGLKNRAYSCEQRMLLMRLSLTFDMVPRMAMIVVTPVGLHLASRSGLVVVAEPVFVVIWALAAAWMIGEWLAFRRLGQPGAVRFYIINGTFMMIYCCALIGFGISSFMSSWPFADGWIALKVLLAGLVFLVSTMMAVFYAPIEGILQQMEVEGTSNAIEVRLRLQVNRGAFWTVLLFVLLASIGYLGLAKPF